MIGPRCAQCKGKFCTRGITDEKILPDFCPMKEGKKLIAESREKYGNEQIRRVYGPATLNEKEAYEVVRGRRIPVRPRIKELLELAKKLKIAKIGIAFCSGLSEEAARLTNILEKQGFEVYSALCKCGAIDKTELGIPKNHKIGDPEKFEAACNPVLQANLLNKAGTEMNIIVGLCIGHDMIFTMNSKAPVTTLIVKDRYTGHHPSVSMYTAYHKNLLGEETD